MKFKQVAKCKTLYQDLSRLSLTLQSDVAFSYADATALGITITRGPAHLKMVGAARTEVRHPVLCHAVCNGGQLATQAQAAVMSCYNFQEGTNQHLAALPGVEGQSDFRSSPGARRSGRPSRPLHSRTSDPVQRFKCVVVSPDGIV